MKKKLLLALVLIIALFAACGKSKDDKASTGTETGIFNKISGSGKNNVAIDIDENLDKYNTYVDLYNSLVDDKNPIAKFDDDYWGLFHDDEGNFVKQTHKGHVETFAWYVESSYVQYDKLLEKVKKHSKEKPKYDIDANVVKIIELSGKIKEKTIEIGNYYSKKFYIDDDFAKGQKLDKEYVEIFEELSDNIIVFMDGMEEIETKVEANLVEEYERNGQVAQLNMKKFKIAMDTISDIVYQDKDYKYSNEDLEDLKTLNNRLLEIQTELEKITDKQLEKEGIPLNIYKNIFVKRTKELIEYTGSLISRIEQKKSQKEIEERADDFSRAYSNVVDAYNSMID